jgi:hypothetical protein
MGRVCASCGTFCERHEFSPNQWRKNASARCYRHFQRVPGPWGRCITISKVPSNSDAGYVPAAPRILTLFHGTSWTSAQSIEHHSFIPSDGGGLGAGIYLGQRDTATRCAQDSARHQSSAGGLVEVLVTLRNPKYVNTHDVSWRSQGYDACRADHISAPANMEWCIRDGCQVQIIRINKISLLLGTPPVEPSNYPQCGSTRARKRASSSFMEKQHCTMAVREF